jgi:hypothetical protein
MTSTTTGQGPHLLHRGASRPGAGTTGTLSISTQATSTHAAIPHWRSRGIGTLRIVFGVIWAVDADVQVATVVHQPFL